MGTITKMNGVAVSGVAKINGIVTSGVSKISGQTWPAGEVTLPTGLIIPYTGGAGGAPTGWSIYNTADNSYIIGAGDTYAVNDNGAGTGALGDSYASAGSHTGGSYSYSGGSANAGLSAGGSHSHTFSWTYVPPYQMCYLIKADAGNTEFPTNGVVFDYSGADRSGAGLSNIWTDGYMFEAGAGTGTGGSNSPSTGASSSSGGHNHGSTSGGNSGGKSSKIIISTNQGAHTHTKTATMTNGLRLGLVAAWSDTDSVFDLSANMIGLFENTTAPDGWYLCDGNNGTPDLRNYFLKCVAFGSAGSRTGTGIVTWDIAAGSHSTHAHNAGNDSSATGENAYHADNVAMGSHAALNDNTTWLPAYYSLAFIMYGG